MEDRDSVAPREPPQSLSNAKIPTRPAADHVHQHRSVDQATRPVACTIQAVDMSRNALRAAFREIDHETFGATWIEREHDVGDSQICRLAVIAYG
jgi:hypothetical protein